MKNENQISSLIDAYKDLKSSKMVLAEKHISKLLKVVAENEDIYNLIAERILGYDFIGAMNDLVEGTANIDELIEGDNVIPFMFCVLNEIDNKNIETIAFVKKVYDDDSEDAFKEFCEKLVGAFVTRIQDYLGKDTEGEEEFLDPATMIESMFTKDLVSRVKYIVSEVSERVKGNKKIPEGLQKDIDVICYSIDLCIENCEFIGVFGLLCGLKQSIYPLKKFKEEIREIDFILDTMNQD